MPPKRSTPASVTFDTTLTAMGKNTGIVVPPHVLVDLGAGKRPPVIVEINGYQYRNTVGSMGGKQLVSVSAAVRSAAGLEGGDEIHVTLTVASEPRPVDVPTDFDAALAGSKKARAFFGTLSNSMQRFHIDNINGAKTPETRQRRIDKAIELFLAGKQR
jgi:hypothetical protein